MRFKTILTIFSLVIIFFIAYPFFNMIFTADSQEVSKAFMDKEIISSVLLTIRASLWATLGAFLFGIPLSYILARYNFIGKKIIEGIVDIPVIIPHTAAGIALLSVWGRNSLFGKTTGISLMGTEIAISIAMGFVSLPFFINSVKNGFKLIDERYEKAAITLGATKLKAFYTIALPMVKKSIISGAIMMWSRGISEFGAVIVLAYHPMTAPVLIFERYESFGLKYAKPAAVILIIICLSIFIILRIFEDRKNKNQI